jgi:hypothetical protein
MSGKYINILFTASVSVYFEGKGYTIIGGTL